MLKCRLGKLWGWGVPRAGCSALVQCQLGEMPAAPSSAPKGPAGESHLTAEEPGFPSQTLTALEVGNVEGSSSSSPLLVALCVTLSPCHVPPTALLGCWACIAPRGGPLMGEQLPLTAQRLLHDEVHGAGVCVWLGQCPALIHRSPGLLTWATCAGREGQGWGYPAEVLCCPG